MTHLELLIDPLTGPLIDTIPRGLETREFLARVHCSYVIKVLPTIGYSEDLHDICAGMDPCLFVYIGCAYIATMPAATPEDLAVVAAARSWCRGVISATCIGVLASSARRSHWDTSAAYSLICGEAVSDVCSIVARMGDSVDYFCSLFRLHSNDSPPPRLARLTQEHCASYITHGKAMFNNGVAHAKPNGL